MNSKKKVVLALIAVAAVLAVSAGIYISSVNRKKAADIPSPENYKIEVAGETSASKFDAEDYEPLSMHTKNFHPDSPDMTFAQANMLSSGLYRNYINNEMKSATLPDGTECFFCGSNHELYYTFDSEKETADCYIKKNYTFANMSEDVITEIVIADIDADIITDKTGVPRVNTKNAKKITDESGIKDIIEAFRDKNSSYSVLISRNGLDKSKQYVFLAGFRDGVFYRYVGDTVKTSADKSSTK